MNKHLLSVLMDWPRPYISGTDLMQTLDKSDNSRYAIIKRATEAGFLIPLRRDLYLVKNLRQPLIDSFEIAPLIYGPSYVSFESALSYHGWIPEAVRTTTCATTRRSKGFQTSYGIFSYEHIPAEVFPFGVEQHPIVNRVTLFIASPMKALADLIYARKRNWRSVEDLYEDLRIESELIKNSDRELIRDLVENYPNQRVKNTLSYLQEDAFL